MSASHKSVGIVVPIYNVAKYLERCLDSILAQSYTHFYVALVNDGSSDESLEIAKRYVAKDSRFVLFDKPNGGQSSARNVGIGYFARRYASSDLSFVQPLSGGGQLHTIEIRSKDSISTCYVHRELVDSHPAPLEPPHIDYIMFLDSDDYWVEDCLLECLRVSDGADVVWFEYQAVFDKQITPRDFRTHLQAFGYENPEVISNLDWAKRAIDRDIDFCSTSAWQVCIDFGFFMAHNLSFLDGVKSEDTLFSLYLFSLARRIVILPKVLYCYYIRAGSINDFDKMHTIASLPPYLRAMCPCYDDVKELQEYYQLASYFLMLEQFFGFLEILKERDRELSELLYRAFVPLLVKMSLGLIDFPKDPLHLTSRFWILKSHIPKGMRPNPIRYCAVYMPSLFAICKPILPLYVRLKRLERSLRHACKKRK